MRALLTPEVVPRLGVVLFKPGRELMSLFSGGRVLVAAEPKNMTRLPSGRVPDARQPLADDQSLVSFFTDDRVIRAAGGLSGLEYWLLRRVKECQYPHSGYHHKELVTMRHAPGSMVLCWHCENQLREQTTEQLADLARRNVIAWVIDTVLVALGYNRERELSLGELCWWAVYAGVADAITESMAASALRLPVEPLQSVYKESDITPSLPATRILASRLEAYNAQVEQPMLEKPVVRLSIDPEPPAAFFARPKRHRWQNADYISWVKTQPCCCCGNPADDAHHLIGYGQGGMGTKAHDSFTIPLCREHHTELHNDPVKFERKYGSQLEMLKNVLDRAFALCVLA
ncbi:DUF968 domain-containing protein [Citrobacter koseri]|uniref:DUF968 domain-containing protein n=1 Tax=Citrobacter koseri TaxID=545 RepID=UPI0019040EA8|nr:DUF968 domain-containing protein [Citrobacter koseri]MBJ8809850.1 DUF968 domain-containing protein [Citrobacter koseri]